MRAQTKKLLMFGTLGYVAFWLYKKRQAAMTPVVASASAPTTSVSPTAAPTTMNMQALAGLGKMLPEGAQYYTPEDVSPIIASAPKPMSLSGGYGLPRALPIRNGVRRYPSASPYQRFN